MLFNSLPVYYAIIPLVIYILLNNYIENIKKKLISYMYLDPLVFKII